MRHRHLLLGILHWFFVAWILDCSFATVLDKRGSIKRRELQIHERKSNVTKWSTKQRRSKRDIWQLYGVITCMTPCDPFVLKDYGCYCGLGGTGNPVDDIDRCCMLHDYCYHHTPCHQALTYFLPYNWKCVGGRPHCSLPARWSPAYSCAIRLCECDRMFSECLNSHGCPKDKALCNSSQVRHMWQKFLIKLGIG